MKTINEVSELLSVNAETVRRWIRTGKLKAQCESKKSGYVIFEKDLNEFLEKRPKYAWAKICSIDASIDWDHLEDKLLNDISASEKRIFQWRTKINNLYLLIEEEEKKLSKLREFQKKIKESD